MSRGGGMTEVLLRDFYASVEEHRKTCEWARRVARKILNEWSKK